ncbi:MAG: serine hydrolase, partial [Flavobacteriales bacterium]
LDFEPGKQFNYSNSGYVLLGAIIEVASEKSYEEFLQENIFDPLGMKDSGYDHNLRVLDKRASGYFSFGRVMKNANYIDMSTPFSAGALYSTVEDMFLWDQALYTDQLLSEVSRKLVFEKHVSQGNEFYGYGWDIDVIKAGGITDLSKDVVAHSGFINGFNTRITRFIDDQSTVIVFNNTSGAPLYHMTTAIAGILYDQDHIAPKQAVANQTAILLEQEGIAKAKKYFNDYKYADNCYLDEGEMNMLGYGYLEERNLEFANFIFELNKTEFHYSANTYDSYAEVQLALGNREVAIKNYGISLQKNPENQNAINVLSEMGVDIEELLEELLEELGEELELDD